MMQPGDWAADEARFMDLDDLLSVREITTRPPASPASVAEAERRLGVAFPDDYRTLLLRSNGVEGFVSPDSFYLVLHPVEFVSKHPYEPNLVPELVVIGSDGGGEVFGFIAQQGGAVLYVCVPFIGDGLASMDRLATSLAGFVECLRANDFA